MGVENSVFCNKSEILKFELEQRVLNPGSNDFHHAMQTPHKHFEAFEEKMNPIHGEVNAGAAASGEGILTGHGMKHIQSVINIAGKLIGDKLVDFSGYEIYILLLASHLHDVGNYSGRGGHEEKIRDIINNVQTEALNDTPIKELVIRIASVHGGESDDGDKDKISKLHQTEPCNSIVVRSQLLASILRFSDELADDSTRVANLPVPEKNEIYHKYCSVLSPVTLTGNTVTMHYHLSDEDITNKYSVGRKKKYLYDYIFERLEKCMRELEYCRMYADGVLRITTLSVKINFPHDAPIDTLEFRLTLQVIQVIKS